MTAQTWSEHASIFVAGFVFVFGLSLVVVPVSNAFFHDGKGFAGFGLLAVTAYATGHLIAFLGNVVENFITLTFRSPSDFVTLDPPMLLPAARIGALEERIRSRLGLKIDRITGADRENWRKMMEQIYADVTANSPGQIHATFGSYLFNRDLCAACLALAIAVAVCSIQHWAIVIGLAVAALIYGYRMRRFDVRFCRELLLRFLALPAKQVAPSGSSRPS